MMQNPQPACQEVWDQARTQRTLQELDALLPLFVLIRAGVKTLLRGASRQTVRDLPA